MVIYSLTLSSSSSSAAVGATASVTVTTTTKITQMAVTVSWKDIVYEEEGIPDPSAAIDTI